MNKGITLLILLAVLGAMGLVLYSHTRNSSEPPQLSPSAPPAAPGYATTPSSSGLPGYAQSNVASPLQAPQGDNGGLRSIEPPLSGGRAAEVPTARQGNDGVPKAVVLAAPVDGRPAQSSRFPDAESDKPQAASPAAPSRPALPEQKTQTPPPLPDTAPEAAPSRPKGAEDEPRQAGRPPASSVSPPSGGDSRTAVTKMPEKKQPPEDKPAPKEEPSVEKKQAPAPRPAETDVTKKKEPSGESAATPPAVKPNGPPGLTVGPTPWDTPQPSAQEGSQNSNQAGAASLQAAATAPPKDAPAGRDLPDKGTHALKNISLSSSGSALQLRIEADSPFPCKTFTLTGPDRLVIDLPGAWQGMKAPAVPENALVKKVRLGQQTAGPRLVLDLSGPLKNHTVNRAGNVLEVMVQ